MVLVDLNLIPGYSKFGLFVPPYITKWSIWGKIKYHKGQFFLVPS